MNTTKTKTKKARHIPGTTKALHSVEGVHIGSVTEYDDGNFLGYFAPLGYGEWKSSRAEAETFVVKAWGEDVPFSTWQEAA